MRSAAWPSRVCSPRGDLLAAVRIDIGMIFIGGAVAVLNGATGKLLHTQTGNSTAFVDVQAVRGRGKQGRSASPLTGRRTPVDRSGPGQRPEQTGTLATAAAGAADA